MRWERRRRGAQDTELTTAEIFAARLEAARLGDRESVAWLYSEHVGMVRGYFRACLMQEFDDLTSDVFVGMIKSLDRFTGDERMFRSWLMSIAHRRRVDHLRRCRVRLVDTASDEAIERHLDAARGPGDLGWIADVRIVSGLATLTDEQREVVALRYVADMSLLEVAEATGRTVGSVKSLQNRAIGTLRRVVPDLRIAAAVR